jgi:hypothetical protein
MPTIVTYKFRIKDSTTTKKLNKMAGSVNFIWNYCNEISMKAIRYNSEWLSGYDFNYLTSGCSKELGLHAQTIQAVGEEYANQRNIHKKFKLKWHNTKRSLGANKRNLLKLFIPKLKIIVKIGTVKYQLN